MDGTEKQGRLGKIDFGPWWAEAERLKIEAGGLTGPLVKAAVEAERARLAAKAKTDAEKKAKQGEQAGGEGAGANAGAGGAAGDVAGNAGAGGQKAVALADLDQKTLKRLAEYLGVKPADARKPASFCEAISKCEAWAAADQVKILKAITQAAG